MWKKYNNINRFVRKITRISAIHVGNPRIICHVLLQSDHLMFCVHHAFSNHQGYPMKTLSASLKAVVIASLACAAGLASAAVITSQTLTVTATVSKICSFSASTNTLSFGPIDPSSTSNATATGSLSYNCTKGTTAPTIVTSDANLNRTMTGSGGSLNYTLSIGATSAPTGFGATAQSVSLGGMITPAQFQNAGNGDYTESVVLNITP